MLKSIGIRQIPHFRRRRSDVRRLPFFVLQLTFFVVPIRILAFATMLHQGWSTRGEGRTWRNGVVPRVATLFAVAALATAAAIAVTPRPSLERQPALAGQEVILEAPGPQPAHR